MKRIFLIGYMGSGKSTLGRAFAKATGLAFVDLDSFIEERMHSTVRELFAERGEDSFRKLEMKILHEVSEFEDVVIACGGGTPCFYDNMDFMNSCGTTVFLDVSIERLFERLKVGRVTRPLLANKTDEELVQFIAEGVAGRVPFYSKAQLRIDGSKLESVAQIDGTVEERRMGM